jgi:dGTPase
MTLKRILDQESRLDPQAARSSAAYRAKQTHSCPFRNQFQRDRDRILHSKAFRRLAHKTQVFIAASGDHFRTRLTHTLEVSQIARTMARAMNLNEDLTEAISLGHDLGHTPFGHAGERLLNRLLPQGFRHQDQSLRVVQILARDGEGLNLTDLTLDGIGKHSKGRGPIFVAPPEGPITLEGALVRAADIIAYLAHDLDDALEAGLLKQSDVPKRLSDYFGCKASNRIETMVSDLTNNSSLIGNEITLIFSKATSQAMEELRGFLDQKVYAHPKLDRELNAGQIIIERIFRALTQDDGLLATLAPKNLANSRAQAACDFISGMTDRYAVTFAANLE